MVQLKLCLLRLLRKIYITFKVYFYLFAGLSNCATKPNPWQEAAKLLEALSHLTSLTHLLPVSSSWPWHLLLSLATYLFIPTNKLNLTNISATMMATLDKTAVESSANVSLTVRLIMQGKVSWLISNLKPISGCTVCNWYYMYMCLSKEAERIYG